MPAASLLTSTNAGFEPLVGDWECASTAPGVADSPQALPLDLRWYRAEVPGTFAAALRANGVWDGEAPLDLDGQDVWFRVSYSGGVEEILRFEGLATIADVWLNNRPIAESRNMFLPVQADVTTEPANQLHIRFASLTRWLDQQRGRARWRTRLASPATLRFARTTLLGRMPGWCPSVQPVGPWRPILRMPRGTLHLSALDARVSLADGAGRLTLRCSVAGRVPANLAVVLQVDETACPLAHVGSGEFAGEIVIPYVDLWWPHTHGPPRLYAVALWLDGTRCDLGRVGFRQIEIDRGHDGNGFGLTINGEPVFCRGACWTTPDIVTLAGDAASYRPALLAMRDAGLNMVRVGGTMVYEADAFYALCDELGILVWQDAMLASFDYPSAPEFRASLTAELQHFLARTQRNPSLAVFCGGSEMLQQASMFGLTADRVDASFYRSVIPELVRQVRPDLSYVENSPAGGDIPFQTDRGVTHYYGVGAYLRPLSDARLADVRFASECLAIANVPAAPAVEASGISTSTDPRWKRGVPRDPGAGWDFDDVRDHYLQTLFDVDPLRLRYADFDRYLELSRAVSCILVEETFNSWRRVGSNCRGALLWQWQDVMPGAGWGMLGSDGHRKPVWYALQRASRPRQIILTDEGMNGLAVHIINETAEPLHGILRLTCLKDGRTPVREAERSVDVAPRAATRISSHALLPAFFDITYAYRFGPPGHDVTVAQLYHATSNALIADAYHFPHGAASSIGDVGLEVRVEHSAAGWSLCLSSQHLARFLHIEDTNRLPAENWLHLSPGHERRIALLPRTSACAVPEGEIRALNMDRVVRYAG